MYCPCSLHGSEMSASPRPISVQYVVIGEYFLILVEIPGLKYMLVEFPIYSESWQSGKLCCIDFSLIDWLIGVLCKTQMEDHVNNLIIINHIHFLSGYSATILLDQILAV